MARLVRISLKLAGLALVLVVLVFAALRVAIDAPNIASGTMPDRSSFDSRYAAYPWLAYVHIAPAALYLSIAPFQLWRGLRTRHLERHRRVGRIALTAGIVGGLGGVAFGLLMPYGGALEASASVVFGSYLAITLALAYRAIRRGAVREHRRWMIRAFAVGLGAATVRLWIVALQALGGLTFQESFGVAFWLAFPLHVVAGELWLRWRPTVPEARPRAFPAPVTSPSHDARAGAST